MGFIWGKKVNVFLCVAMMSVVFLLGFSSQAMAEYGLINYVEGDYTYDVPDGKARIVKYSGTASQVVIPSTLGGYPVAGIDFKTFSDCPRLKCITIPQSVFDICGLSFYGCPSLTSILVDESNPYYKSINGVVYDKAGSTLVACPGGLTSLSLPQEVTRISYYACSGCTNLTSISMPGVTSIGKAAFTGCTGLTSIIIPPNVTSLGEMAFSNCTGLKSINFNASTTTIYDNGYTIPSQAKIIGLNPSTAKDYAVKYNRKYDTYIFNQGTITGYIGSGGEVNIPDSLGGYPVTGIGAKAFQDCTGITSINLPQGLTSIGDRAFSDCRGITSISLPQGLTSIGVGAFSGCSGITSISLPPGLTSIGANAFWSCSGITSISLPPGLTSIDANTFNSCRGIISISLPQGLTSIGGCAFQGCTGLTSISLPLGLTSIGAGAFEGCTGITSISLPQGLTSIDNYIFSGCRGITSISLPPRLTSIGASAFQGCTGMTRISLPQGLTSIGNSAFMCSGLTSINIPQGVLKIDCFAFLGCNNLTTIVFDSPSTKIYDESKIIPSQATIIGFDPSTAKDYATKYNRKFEVIPPNSIAITSPANKLIYNVGEQLDLTGLVVTGTYTGGITRTVNITAANISGFNSSAPAADQVLTITVGGKTATYTVTIIDNIPPVITPPADMTAEATGIQTVLDIGQATAADASPVTITNDAPAAFPLGTTAVTWKAVDSNGNSSTAAQTIIIQDTTAPVLTIPADVSAEAAAERTVVDIGTAAATDIFTPVTVTNDAPADYPIGITTVTWKAVDANGNTSTAQQKISVIDKIPPVLTVPADVNAEASAVRSVVDLGKATATDFSQVTITNDAPADFPLGETLITWTAIDESGNQSKGQQKITIVDTTDPVLTVPADISTETADMRTMVDIGTATAADIFTPVTVTNDAPADYPIGTTTITWKAVDPNGNTATSTQKVTVAGVPTTVQVTGAVSIILPASGITAESYAAIVKDQVGNIMTDAAITWSINPSAGVSIDASGVLTVTPAAEVGSYTVTATSRSASGSCQLTISKAPSVATTLEVSGSSAISIPKLGIQKVSYAAVVKDQYGCAMTVKKFKWNLQDAGKWVTINRSNGEVNVLSFAKPGSFTVAATNGTLSGSLTVTLVSSSATSISINKSETTIKAGESETLVAAILPENASIKNVIWWSSHMTVALVDCNGTVTGLREGTAIITATTLDGGFKASCKVTVTQDEVLVKSVIILPEQLNIKVNDSVSMKALVLPINAGNKNVAWASSDESVAVVDTEGKVKAVSPGVAKITATSTDGTNIFDACDVTVEAPGGLSNIILGPFEVTLKVGEIFELKTKLTLPELNQNLCWISSIPEVASVNEEGVVTSLQSGSTEITASNDDGSYIAKYTVTVASEEEQPQEEVKDQPSQEQDSENPKTP